MFDSEHSQIIGAHDALINAQMIEISKFLILVIGGMGDFMENNEVNDCK